MSKKYGLKSRSDQRDENFRGFSRQVQGLERKLQEASSSSHARHQRLQINAIEHEKDFHEAFDRAAIQCSD